MSRDCKKCIHHISGSCDAWECNMKTLEDYRNKVIDEVLEVAKRTYHNFGGHDLEFMQKYGNPTNSLQYESYSTMMMYEIAGEFDDLLDNLEQLKGGAE